MYAARIARMHELKGLVKKEGEQGFNCMSCSAWNPQKLTKARLVDGTSAFLFSCVNCGAEHKVPTVRKIISAVGIRVLPYVCANCGKTTRSRGKPRFEGTTAIVNCEHCGAEHRGAELLRRDLLTNQPIKLN